MEAIEIIGLGVHQQYQAGLIVELQSRTDFPKAYFLFGHKVLRAFKMARFRKNRCQGPVSPLDGRLRP
jgi:hypothetical protein